MLALVFALATQAEIKRIGDAPWEKIGHDLPIPIVTRDAFYATVHANRDGDPALLAFGMDDGRRRWEHAYDAKYADATPEVRVDGDRVALRTERRMVLLHAAAGTVLAEQTRDDNGQRGPQHRWERIALRSDGLVVELGGEVFSFGRDGKKRWSFAPPKEELFTHVFALESAVVVRTVAQRQLVEKMRAFGPDGREKWTWDPPMVARENAKGEQVKQRVRLQSFTPVGDILYAGGDGAIVAIQAETGETQVRVHAGTHDTSRLLLDAKDEPVWFPLRPWQKGRPQGPLRILSMRTGRETFVSDASTRLVGQVGRLVILDDQDGGVRAIDPAAGRERWSRPGPRTGRAIVIGSWVCFGDREALVVLDGATGAMKEPLALKLDRDLEDVWMLADPPGFVVNHWPEMRVFDARTGALSGPIRPDPEFPRRPTFHRDASGTRAMCFVSVGGQVRVWTFRVSVP